MREITPFDVLLGSLPMLFLIGAFVYFFWRMRYGKDGADFTSLERRKVEALERIAAALEKRP